MFEFFQRFPAGYESVPRWFLLFALNFFGAVQFQQAMEHEDMANFLSPPITDSAPPQFDLVIVESFGKEAFYAFAEHFQAPLIVVSPLVNTNWMNLAVGNVEPWSLVANPMMHVGPEGMSLVDRGVNILFNLYEQSLLQLFALPVTNSLIRRYFPKNQKSIQEVLRKDICLGFVNTHFTLSFPRPYVPNLIEIGGVNIDRERKPLPQDIQEFLDSASDGAILFSMGSLLDPRRMSDRHRGILISAFSKLKQKVIWRYNLPDANQLPDNIMGRVWLPQREILAHPNIKLFITHAGMLSQTEAYYYGVPMIAIPVFYDQPLNMARSVQQGVAVHLDHRNITEEAVSWAIQEVLDNPKYSENIQTLSAAYHDQPMTPQELVVYWSEYVVKYKCPTFMRVPGHEMGVIEYYNLDCLMIAVIFAVLTWLMMRRAKIMRRRGEIQPGN